ncbi:MAG: alpha/beta hydrolase [Patescibacteria group bacterium]|nr:alpha/beta hydrolase [Patescibacteria group bacterium]
MSNIFIIHGVGGDPQENWFPWLKAELEKEGNNVFIPHFPTQESGMLEAWWKVFNEYKDQIDENTIFIGHSLGAPFILNVLEKYPAKAAYLVAGFVGPQDNQFYKYTKEIADRDFDWNKINDNCSNFYIFQSDNDPYIPMEKAEELKEKLDTEYILIKNAGHFNEKAGHKEFPELCTHIKSQKA